MVELGNVEMFSTLDEYLDDKDEMLFDDAMDSVVLHLNQFGVEYKKYFLDHDNHKYEWIGRPFRVLEDAIEDCYPRKA